MKTKSCIKKKHQKSQNLGSANINTNWKQLWKCRVFFMRFSVDGKLADLFINAKSWFCLLNLDSNCRDMKQSLVTYGGFESGDSDVHAKWLRMLFWHKNFSAIWIFTEFPTLKFAPIFFLVSIYIQWRLHGSESKRSKWKIQGGRMFWGIK